MQEGDEQEEQDVDEEDEALEEADDGTNELLELGRSSLKKVRFFSLFYRSHGGVQQIGLRGHSYLVGL